VAEVSSLAVKKGFNKQQGRILFPLLKFMYHYSVEYFGVTHFVIAVNPKWIDFYRSVLLFTDLTQKPVSSYDFVDGAPAYGAILDLRWAKWEYSRVYGTKKTNHNLSYFFQELECTNMEFPLRNKSLISDPVMSPELMEYFFIKRTQVFESLSEMEKFVLREMYNSPGYHQLIPEPTVVQMRSRKRKRLETNLDGRLYAKDSDTPIKVQIQSISEKGLGGYLPEKIEQGRYTIHVNVEGQGPCIITGHIARISEEGAFGFVIDSISREWLNFFNSVDGRIILDAKAFKNSKSKTG
jgi:hypothetical protein